MSKPLTNVEMKEILKQYGFRGYSKLDKAQLKSILKKVIPKDL
jgi:hypothetical protein